VEEISLKEAQIKKIYRKLGGKPVLLPVPKGEKYPAGLNGWQKLTYAESRSREHQKLLIEKACIGVLLGPAGDNIVAFDIDSDEWVEAVLKAMPMLARTFQTRGARGRNCWFRLRGDYPDAKLTFTTAEQIQKDPRRHVGELRMGGGHQSIIFGPHKETGKPYQWLNDFPLAEFDYEEIFSSLPADWIRASGSKGKKKGAPAKEPASAQQKPDTDPLSRCLADHIEDLVLEIFPLAESKREGELAIGSLKGESGQSLRICTRPEKAGLWKEHNGGAGGNFIDLLCRKLRVTPPDALEWVKERYLDYFEVDEQAVIYHAGRHKGLLTFCLGLAKRIAQVEGQIFNSCGAVVVPTRRRVIGGVEVERLSLAELSAQGFRSEIQKYVTVYRYTAGKRLSKVLGAEDARAVLESSAFREHLQPIRGLCDVELPCGIKERKELLALHEGCNPASGILVQSAGFKFAHNWSVEKASAYYRELYSEFCFRADDRDRSLSVAIAMNLTLFGYYLLSPDALRPAFLVNANREGAGKTLVVKIALIGRYGSAIISAMPPIEDQRQKQIFAAARCRDGVVAWDNIRGDIKSQALEAAITSVNLSDRLLHTHTTAKVRHELVFLLTTNGAVISPDLRRRSLSIELHLENLRAEDRVIAHWLDDEKLALRRSSLCAAAWALLRNWVEMGSPAPQKIIPGFENWSQVIGGTLEAAGFASPTEAPHSRETGIAVDSRNEAIEALVKAIGESPSVGHTLKFEAVWDFATRFPVVRDYLELDAEGASESDARKCLGKLLQRHDGDVIGGYRFLRRKLPKRKFGFKVCAVESREGVEKHIL
jgi:hypothetical protein